jgi:glucokinase
MKPSVIGIEIGGTKVQVGLGSTDGTLLKILRNQVDPKNGASGIRRALVSMVGEVLDTAGMTLSNIDRIGIGFGGPVDVKRGRILKSYQINGWDNFPLKDWAEEQWDLPVMVQNDASTAGLAESVLGRGRGYSRVFYITIGSGIGGGWIVNGRIDDGQGLGSAEIGHMWVPDPQTGMPTGLEQVCSGWAIGRRAQTLASWEKTIMTDIAKSLEKIDAKVVYSAAEQGDIAAKLIITETCQTLGIAIGNVINLLHPERVIIGGGVSLMGALFWNTLLEQSNLRMLPLLSPQVDIVSAELKEDVVVIGALCLA